MRRSLAVPLGIAAAGSAALAYGAGYEVRAPRLRQRTVRVLPPGSAPFRLLHISDAHLTPAQRWKVEWVRGLARLTPDYVVNSGDTIAHQDAVPVAMEMLEPLLAFPGAFVGGSNDYFAPKPKNPGRYLLPDDGRRIHGPPLPWPDLRAGMTAAGWVDCTNQRRTVAVGPLLVDLAGVDDPHIKRDRYVVVAGPVDPEAGLALGIVHSPEPRVLDGFARDGFGLVLAGHTHGGQLRVPFYGALVTNCGLDTDRARGLSQWGDDGMWLHVSAGLGTSPYAPVRFACPPEATLLTLVAR